jgi:hypothetical protein
METQLLPYLFALLVYRLSGELDGLFLQAPPLKPPTGWGPGPAGARDSGYDSLHRRLSLLDRVSQTHAVWLQLGCSHHDTVALLESQSPGVSREQQEVSQAESIHM